MFSRPLMFLKEPGTLYAVATGLFIAAYSIWDKVGVRYVAPFLYMYLMALGTGIILTPYILRSRGLAAVREEWRVNSWTIIGVGALTFLAYGLVLSALALSKVSYVWPAREIGIVVAGAAGQPGIEGALRSRTRSRFVLYRSGCSRHRAGAVTACRLTQPCCVCHLQPRLPPP